MKQTPNGVAVTKFTVAVNRRFDHEKADFINCEAWRNTAEFIAKYFSKGKEIAIIGEIHIDKSEKDGKTSYFTNVVVDEAEFCGSKSDGTETKGEMIEGAPNMAEMEEDDLPF